MLLSFTLLVSVHLVKLYDANLRQGELLAQKQSMSYIEGFTYSINNTLSTLEILRSAMLQMREDSIQDRDYVVHLLEQIVDDNPYLLGTYTMWEPDAFDNDDSNRRNQNLYEDDTGRFIPYIYRSYDEIHVLPVSNDQKDGKADSYEQAKQSKKFTLLEPFEYAINGEEQMMTTFMLPIVDQEGQFLGVVGADISLQTVQSGIEYVHPLGGNASIITSQNNYLANSAHPEWVMEPYVDLPGGLSIDEFKQNKMTKLYTVDPETSETVLRMFYPIKIQDDEWHYEMVIPKRNMLTEFRKSLLDSIVISVVALIIITLLMVLLVKRIVLQNINKVVHVSSALARGDLNQKLDIQGNDEFAYMAQQFNRMIDYRKDAEELIQFQATHDLLTGLPNRYGFSRYFETQFPNDYNGNSALLYIDLDRFKIINEALDYAMGDLLLKQVAERIVSKVTTGGKVFRFGGDEFIVLLDQVSSLHQAIVTADDILLAIADPILMNDRLFYMTASIGMSLQHELNEKTGDRLVKESDIALYVAKKQRNTCILYSPSLNDISTKDVVLENSLFAALENNQFLLYYQPKVEISTGNIYGAEALLRWKHPELGMISPLEFIPLAEKTGFIIPLGEWVLKTACQQIKQWEAIGITSISVSVNMSMIQFQQKYIVHTIEKIITEAGVRPDQIELELTESIFMDNPEHTLRILNDLQQLGVKLSLDDFGTGYSSLSYLQNIPLHYLKLDKTFINDIVSDIKKQMIFKSLIVIAHNLNMKVVTEGVETQEELQIISEHNCDIVQGYFYSPPVPPDKFVALYRASGQ